MTALEKAIDAVRETKGGDPAMNEAIARAVLMAVREPGIDVGLMGAEQVNIQMRGSVKADYCAAQDAFTAMVDAILNEAQT